MSNSSAPVTRSIAWQDAAIVVLVSWVTFNVVEPRVVELTEYAGTIVTSYLLPRAVSLLIVASATWTLLYARRLPLRTVGIRPDGLDTQLMFGVVSFPLAYLAVLVWVGAFYVLRPSAHLGPPMAQQYEFMARLRSSGDIAMGVAVVLVSVCVEELLFRGLLLTRLRIALGRTWLAAVVVSVLFAGEHLPGGASYALNAWLLSLVWCWVFLRSRSLLSVMLSHLLFNLAQLFVLPHLLR